MHTTVDNDLLIVDDAITPAVGAITHLGGRLLDAKGESIRNAVIETWQCDEAGTYLKRHTRGCDAFDPNSPGDGRFLTSSTGEYYSRPSSPSPTGTAPRRSFTPGSRGATGRCSPAIASTRAFRPTSRTAGSSRSGPATPRATRPSASTSRG